MGVDKVRKKIFVDAYLIYAGNNEMKFTSINSYIPNKFTWFWLLLAHLVTWRIVSVHQIISSDRVQITIMSKMSFFSKNVTYATDSSSSDTQSKLSN